MTMAKVLIHIPHAIGRPAGAWRIEDDTLSVFYPDDIPLEHIVRARVAIAARGDNVPFDAWFEQLADRTPYADDYEVIDADLDTPLEAILSTARTAWTIN